MKLTLAQLETQITRTLSPIYLVSGDEPLLKNDAIRLIKKSALKAGFTEHIRLSKEAGHSLEEQLQQTLFAVSLLADKRVLLIDLRESSVNKAAGAILKAYAEKPIANNIVILDMNKLDTKVTKSDWYQVIEKTATTIPIWPLTREQMPSWLQQRAKKYQIQLKPDAARLLTDYVEGNLVAAAQTIEKLYLLNPSTPVSIDLIEEILSDESRFTVFDLIDNIITQNTARSLHILKALEEDGIEASLVLWAITRELRVMADIFQQIQKGARLETLFTQFRIFAKRQSAVRNFIQKKNLADCEQYLLRAAHVDAMIKGGAPGNPWQALTWFCLDTDNTAVQHEGAGSIS